MKPRGMGFVFFIARDAPALILLIFNPMQI